MTVSGNNASRVFQVDSGVTATISGLTISGGNAGAPAPDGGGLENLGTVTVSACTFTSNSVPLHYGTAFGGLGGGLYNNVGATATVSACSFTGNSATPVSISGTLINGVGGGLFNFGTATVSGSTFTSNSASNFGGGLNNGVRRRSARSFTSNSAPDGGGLANVPFGGTATVIGCTFTSNSATNSGGGLFNNNTATVIGSTFTSNSATNGGGLATAVRRR